MKRKITSLKPNECIHIITEKEAKKIAKLADKNDIFNPALKKKGSEIVIQAYNKYKSCCITLETATGYNNELYFCYSSEGFALSEGYELTPASDFIKTKSKLKKRVKALEDAVFATAKTELTELPEKWCVKITEENKDVVHNFRVSKLGCSDFKTDALDWYVNKNGTIYKYSENTEISFADFKRLVLKEKEYPKVEFNKWYKSDSGDCIAFITGHDNDKGFYTGYGIDENKWFDDDDISVYAGWKEATEEEVKTVLISEAKRRGFKKGVDVDLFGSRKSTLKGKYKYIPEWLDDTFALGFGGDVIFRSDYIKWATIIDQPKEVICSQFWVEDSEDKTRWICSTWITEDDVDLNLFELHEVTETDKYGHPTKAIFKLC